MNQRKKINDSSITKATREKRVVCILSVVNFFARLTINETNSTKHLIFYMSQVSCSFLQVTCGLKVFVCSKNCQIDFGLGGSKNILGYIREKKTNNFVKNKLFSIYFLSWKLSCVLMYLCVFQIDWNQPEWLTKNWDAIAPKKYGIL